MFGLRKSLTLGAGAVLVGAAALPLAVLAAGETAAEATQSVASGGEGQVVARDADTGKLRAATADEVQALQRHRAALRSAAGPTAAAHNHWSGARGARLTDEFMTYSVVVKMPDGRLVELCVEDAQTASRSAKAQTLALPTE